jgi:hypothetical protein
VTDAGSFVPVRRSGWRSWLADVRPDRAASRLAVRIRDEPAAAILGVAMAVWAAVFAFLVILRHDRYRTIDFDLDPRPPSGCWPTASRSTRCGPPVFGHHATCLHLLVPFQWLGAEAQLLGRAAGPGHRLGRHPDLPPGPPAAVELVVALGLGVVWLLQPPLQFFA